MILYFLVRKKNLRKKLALLNRNAGKESVRLTPLRNSTTQYNSPQYTAVLRILRRTARSAADAVERTAAQYVPPSLCRTCTDNCKLQLFFSCFQSPKHMLSSCTTSVKFGCVGWSECTHCCAAFERDPRIAASLPSWSSSRQVMFASTHSL